MYASFFALLQPFSLRSMVKAFVTRFETFRVKQLQRPPGRGVDATLAFIVLRKPFAEVVGMADAKRPVGAFENV